jgi:hypothetical protein
MALCNYLKITTVPELVSRLSLVFNQRFYNNEDRMVRIKMLDEPTAQDVLEVWMSWRNRSPDTSPTPSVASDAKTEPGSNI